MPTISHIGQIAICVRDVPAALSFYRDILGLPHLFSPSEQLAFLQCGQTRIMLTEPQGAGEVAHNSILYYQLQDIESFYRELLAAGVVGERSPEFAAPMPDHDLWLAFVKDPEGNLIGLMEEKPKSQ
ncbi:VOC family protein [Pseudoteredinibacter isoporae]|uniref:VOC family protein n=1 Tax=Pseudoteredinibacter isoporae TaxID=570281 RepID=UPI003102D313